MVAVQHNSSACSDLLLDLCEEMLRCGDSGALTCKEDGVERALMQLHLVVRRRLTSRKHSHTALRPLL